MAILRNKQQLIGYIQRKLGAPVIDVEIEMEQIIDNIDDTLQLFSRHAGDVSYRSAMVLMLTGGINEYDIPENVKSVVSMDTSKTIGEGITVLFSPLNQMYNMGFLNFFSGTFGSGLISYEIGMQYLKQTEMLLQSPFSIQFNKYTHKLKVTPTPVTALAGVLEVFTEYDPGTADSDIYNEVWGKRYALALCKISLGTIYRKYGGMTIPGGAILNFADMMAEGNAEKSYLYEELIKTEGIPLEFYMA